MDHAMCIEERNLKLSWDCHPSDYLDHYLVSGVEDPRINGQSILTRALLADALSPGRFDALIAEELRFGAVLTWILQQLEQGSARCELLDAIESVRPTHVPEFVRDTYVWLQEESCPIPDYISVALGHFDCDTPSPFLPDLALDTFMTIWNEQLSHLPAHAISVLEAACGSANDYRFLGRCGLARCLDYTGIDIATRNIANARAHCPSADFRVQSILTTELADCSYDYVFCHDLIEHLSPTMMDRALREMFRIARDVVILHFFNATGGPDHEIVPMRKYHRNRVSVAKLGVFFEHLGGRVTCLEMTQWLRRKIRAPGYHNPNAFSLIVEKQAGLAK
ncbi:MAG: class I SAM-dependent methyltransferase [Phycisphaerae bacterium]|nr:class I SAM-dependent methyltransferase [Phycisphaerae bacterium]